MKFAIGVVLALAVVGSYGHEIAEAISAQDRSISSTVVDIIYDVRDQMPCGFPGMGIGPLAPAHLSHKEIAMNGASFDVDASIDDFYLYGLNDFEVEEFKISTLRSRVDFEFVWKKVYLETIYKLLLKLTGGTIVNMNMGGDAEFSIEDFRIWGRISYSLGVLSGNLRVKEINIYVSVGKVTSKIEGLSKNKYLNKILNEIVEEFIFISINDNTENLAVLTNNYLTPVANALIGDRSLGDLIGIIVGGGSRDGSKREACVPAA